LKKFEAVVTKARRRFEVEILADGTVTSTPPLPKDHTADDFFRMLREKVAASKSGKDRRMVRRKTASRRRGRANS
jgi:hypothetical protein